MGRLTAQTNTNGEIISYGYDGVGNITLIETPTQSISKTYTKRNELESVTDEKGTTTYTYDALGRQTKVSYPNGITTHYTYDSRNRITKIEHKNSNGEIIQSFAYTLDNVGNRTQIVEDTGRTVSYEYNSVNQLIKETVTNDPKQNNTITVFEYDEVGNLKTKTINGINTTYNYNDNDQLITQDTQTLTYDDNGNLITKDDTVYSYDAKNRLIKVQTPTDTIEYNYDANDNRIAKTTTNGTTTYLIDTNTPYAQVITESKENGTKIGYTYGNDLLHNGTHFYLTDALGSTRGLVDSSEKLTDSYSYTPYGELSEHNGTSENSFLYTGEQLDPETENYYLRARYYSPQQARFTSIDPYEGRIAEPITLNDYIYAGGNPIRYVDPSGKFFTMADIGMAMNAMSYIRNTQVVSFAVRTGMFYSMRAIINLNNFILGGSVVTYGVKNRATWGFWNDLPKVIYRGVEYAHVRGFYYTEHAVQRMTPISFGARLGRTDAGRGIPSMAIEYTVTLGKTLSKELVNGGIRYTKVYGDIFVAFEQSTTGQIIIVTVRKASGGK